MAWNRTSKADRGRHRLQYLLAIPGSFASCFCARVPRCDRTCWGSIHGLSSEYCLAHALATLPLKIVSIPRVEIYKNTYSIFVAGIDHHGDLRTRLRLDWRSNAIQWHKYAHGRRFAYVPSKHTDENQEKDPQVQFPGSFRTAKLIRDNRNRESESMVHIG